MSLFGMMNDLEEDPIFGHHMRSMRQMNNMLSSLFSDPFGMLGGGLEGITAAPAFGMRHNALMPTMFNPPPMNRLLNMGPVDGHGASFCSSSVISMTSGPNGPQVYQATSSTRTGPGGIKETRKTVQDSRTGTKKMAIGHHIGERAHIIEREQNLNTGVQEERQDYINLDDEEAEDFDREFQTKARSVLNTSGGRRSEQLALPSNQPSHSQRILSITEVPDNGCDTCGNPSDTPTCTACNEKASLQQNSQLQQSKQQNSSTVGRSGGNQSATATSSSQASASYVNGAPITSRRPIRSSPSSQLPISSSLSGPNHHMPTSVHQHPYYPTTRKSRPLKGPSSSTGHHQ